MARIVYDEGKQYATAKKLKTAIISDWGEISRKYIKQLYKSPS